MHCSQKNSREGYLKFSCSRDDLVAVQAKDVAALNELRALLRRHELIGEKPFVLNAEKGPELVGYGNISKRGDAPGTFVISGTRTGGLAALGPEHYTLVTSYEIDLNTLHCQGRIDASAESFTHAVVYLACPEAMVVAHIHDPKLWTAILGQVPTSSRHAEYGTPEIARDIERLLRDGKARAQRVVAMGGHEDGVIFFGSSAEEVIQTMRGIYAKHLSWPEEKWVTHPANE